MPVTKTMLTHHTLRIQYEYSLNCKGEVITAEIRGTSLKKIISDSKYPSFQLDFISYFSDVPHNYSFEVYYSCYRSIFIKPALRFLQD